MKRISLVFSITLLSLISFAQSQLRVALVAGGQQSDIIEKNDLPGWETTKNNYSGRTGVHLGFIADLPFSERSHFYFQPGVILYNKGRKYAETFDTLISNIWNLKSNEYLNYIDIPLNIVYKINLGKKAKFILGAGPYLSFFYNGKLKTETYTKRSIYTLTENDPQVGNGEGKYKTLDYGANGLAGFEFGRVFITANYSRGLANFFKPAGYTAADYKHEVMGATLGIFLGKPVQAQKKDQDKDGVPDKEDKCPDIAGPIELHGCPDTDKDGIADNEDGCPLQAGPAENKGCPYPDTDKDGVLDKDDKCPNLAGPVDNNGCPYEDRDKDGIPDKDDKCPDVKGLARYNGCPVPDDDGDGVNNEEDKCPNVKGTVANNGCPEEIKKEIIEKVNYAAKRLQFGFASAKLSSSSYPLLDEVAAILAANAGIQLSVEGHSSSDGKYDANMKLSQQRAEAVKAYLEAKGIDPGRISAKGYGPDKPLNTGKTEAEKAKNRRVELILNN